MQNDREIARRAISGDEQALEQLVHQHGPWLINWFRARLRPGAGVDAEDLAQETFLVLLRKHREIRKPEKLVSYLFGIANNLLRAAFRNARKLERIKEEAPPPHNEPSRDAEGLAEAVHALPTELRLTVLAYYSRQITYEETAAILGLSRATVQSHLRRALGLLRKELLGDTDK